LTKNGETAAPRAWHVGSDHGEGCVDAFRVSTKCAPNRFATLGAKAAFRGELSGSPGSSLRCRDRPERALPEADVMRADVEDLDGLQRDTIPVVELDDYISAEMGNGCR
jgi:hypothetical protein